MYQSLAPLAVPTKHTRGRRLRGARLSTKSSSFELRGSIENPPPPIATMCRSAIGYLLYHFPHSVIATGAREFELICNTEPGVKMPSINRILFAMIGVLLLCAAYAAGADDSASIAEAPDASPTFGVFTNPQPVTIEGYSQEAMEPFVSPDGNYLFFNSSNSASPTNLYYATRIDDVTFQFVGEVGGINTEGPLNAVGSMDDNDTFYFVSNRNYVSPTFSTIYSCSFSNGNCSSIAAVPGISKKKLFDINFDACISPARNTLYFDDGVYSSKLQLQRASIAIARGRGDHFKRLNDSATIM